jgi:hypothetical protein
MPLVSSWFRAGPVATINGNPTDRTAGYTNLGGGKSTAPAPAPAAPATMGMSFISNDDTVAVNRAVAAPKPETPRVVRLRRTPDRR